MLKFLHKSPSSKYKNSSSPPRASVTQSYSRSSSVVSDAIPLDFDSGTAQTDDKVGNIWIYIIKRIAALINYITTNVPTLTKEAAAVLIAVLVLGACVVLFVAVYVFVYVARPRPFTVSHSAPFEEYMTKASAEMTEIIIRLSTSMSDGSMTSILSLTSEHITELSLCADRVDNSNIREVGDAIIGNLAHLKSREDLNKDIIRYFEYHRSLASIVIDQDKNLKVNMPARQDFKNDESFLSNITGEVDIAGNLTKFYEEVYLTMDKLRANVTHLSSIIDSACGIDIVPEASQPVMDIHMLRLHMDVYHAQTTLSYETRKSGPGRLPTAIMTLYWWPQVESIYSKSIPNTWTQWPALFKFAVDEYNQLWKGLGDMIAHIPCYMAHSHDAEKRNNVCGSYGNTGRNPKIDGQTDPTEGFTPHRMYQGRTGKNNTVVERFAFGSAIQGFLDLIHVVIPVVTSIADIVQTIANNPFQGLLDIFMILIGIIVGILLYLIYMLLTFTFIYMIAGYFYAFYYSILYAIIVTIVDVALTVLLAIPYALLTFMDVMTGGMVMRMLRCESLPSDWAVVPFLGFENARRRIAGLCANPCTGDLNNFAPALGGTTCACLTPDLPPFCPQQQLFRAYRGLELGSPWMSEGFTPDSSFQGLDQEGQQKQMAEAYRRRTNFIGRCYSATSPYSFMTRHLCSDLKNLLPHDTSEEDREKLVALCRQVHCQFTPPIGDDPTSHLDDLASSPNAVVQVGKPVFKFCFGDVVQPLPDALEITDRLGSNIMMITLAFCLVLVILYALLG